MKSNDHFVVGDWITHVDFGIGQVMGIESKRISGTESHYYRITTKDSTFWLPVDKVNPEKLRSLATPGEIEQTIAALQAPPETLGSTPLARQAAIKSARLKNTLQDVACIVRDLYAYRQKKGELAVKESSAYKLLRQRLVSEWAMVMQKQPDTVTSRLDALLASD